MATFHKMKSTQGSTLRLEPRLSWGYVRCLDRPLIFLSESNTTIWRYHGTSSITCVCVCACARTCRLTLMCWSMCMGYVLVHACGGQTWKSGRWLPQSLFTFFWNKVFHSTGNSSVHSARLVDQQAPGSASPVLGLQKHAATQLSPECWGPELRLHTEPSAQPLSFAIFNSFITHGFPAMKFTWYKQRTFSHIPCWQAMPH